MINLLAAVTLLSACNKSEIDTPHALTAIGFDATQEAITRASSVLAEGASFGVLAYNCPNDYFYSDLSLPDLLYNARVERYVSEGAAGYRYLPSANWPSVGKVVFAAYYPHSSSVAAGSITPTPFTQTGAPSFTIELGREKGPIDFATSVVGPIQQTTGIDDPPGTPARSNSYVNFNFTRHMSYISFRAKAVNMEPNTRLFISYLTIKNVPKKGLFRMEDESWTTDEVDATSGATLNLTSSSFPISETAFTDLVRLNTTTPVAISVFPYQSEEVELNIIYTLEYLLPSGGCEYYIIGTKRIPLSAHWQAGKQHIYDLEFAFNEVFGDKVNFDITVTPWKTTDVNTSID